MDQINVTAWENRTETRSGALSAQMADMARATFGGPDNAVSPGSVMPHLWHWFAFLPATPTLELNSDGHPPLGGFLPPVRLERRMWAGGALQFHQPLHVDEPLMRKSTIVRVAEKEGVTGQMVFVTVDHEISGLAGLAISELQDIVYLPIPESYTPPHKQPVPEAVCLDEAYETGPTLLFRYSALTFNAHRIHYDLPYAQSQEHYPGLVVHGPLQATLLMDAATRYGRRPPNRFTFRGVHPVFAGQPMRVLGAETGTGALSLCTAVRDRDVTYQGLQATAIWEDET